MTVKELIEALSEVDEDCEVYIKINKAIQEAVYTQNEVVANKVKQGNGFVDIVGELE